MEDGAKRVLIYTTWPDAASAKAAARALIRERLVVCVNLLAPATAIFEWEGEVQEETEHPMLMKTQQARVPAIIERVKQLHPYDVPAIIVLPIETGEQAFLEWIGTQTNAG